MPQAHDPLHDYRTAVELEKDLFEGEKRRLETELARHNLRYGRREQGIRLITTVFSSITTLVSVAALVFTVIRDRTWREDERQRRNVEQFQASARLLATSQSVTERQLALQSLERFARDSAFRRDYVYLLTRHTFEERDPAILELITHGLLSTEPDSLLLEVLAAQNRGLADSLDQFGFNQRSTKYYFPVDSATIAHVLKTPRTAKQIVALHNQFRWNVATLQAALSSMRHVPAVSLEQVALGGFVVDPSYTILRRLRSVFGNRELPAPKLRRSGLTLDSTVFIGTRLRGADLSGSRIRAVRFVGVDMMDVELGGALLLDVDVDSTSVVHPSTRITFVDSTSDGSNRRQFDASLIIMGGTIHQKHVDDGDLYVTLFGTRVLPSVDPGFDSDALPPTGNIVCASNGGYPPPDSTATYLWLLNGPPFHLRPSTDSTHGRWIQATCPPDSAHQKSSHKGGLPQ